MSVYDDILDDRKGQAKKVIEKTYTWIHDNPTAGTAEARSALNAWVASLAWTQYAEVIVRHLVKRFGGGSWVTFRNKVLTLEPSLVEQYLEDIDTVSDALGIRTKAEQIRDALMLAGAPLVTQRFEGIEEYKRGFLQNEKVSGTINGHPYTVRQMYNPTFDGTKTDPNPLGWKIV